MKRECGECSLCCTLLPVVPLQKGAGQRCLHQGYGVIGADPRGCRVYRTKQMPRECGVWNCRWLVGDDTADLSRPDQSHLVIDVMPDYITVLDNEKGDKYKLQVIQVWCDPKYPDAHRDPAFRRYLARRGEEGIAALIRFNSRDALTIFPPAMTGDGQFHEIDSGQVEQRTEKDMAEFLSGGKMEIEL